MNDQKEREAMEYINEHLEKIQNDVRDKFGLKVFWKDGAVSRFFIARASCTT